MGIRQLKKILPALLKNDAFEKSLDQICLMPARKVVNPLFSFFYNPDELVKWRAVIAMGAVVARLAHEDFESARIVMRRLMWNLNDESGGIGWGSPEAMGEIMARHDSLAKEYACILVSYINEAGNFLEHEMLQRGVLWGLGRLAHTRPERVRDAAAYLCPFMRSKDPVHRGLAAWTAGAIPSKMTESLLKRLVTDEAKINIFIGIHLEERTVGQLAAEALSRSVS
ncbi:MAG: HEAT repeat domain-containing protein [Deltaproteobacteria bacterium]|nr:HEAT repeat domain-containing protein [Deltaproteobacteria bacterium]